MQEILDQHEAVSAHLKSMPRRRVSQDPRQLLGEEGEQLTGTGTPGRWEVELNGRLYDREGGRTQCLHPGGLQQVAREHRAPGCR